MADSGTARSAPRSHDMIAVYVSKPKAVACTAIGLGLTVVSVLAMLFPDKFQSEVPGGAYLTWIGVVLSGIVTARALVWLAPSAPILLFTHEGVRVDPAMIGDYVLPWSQIRALEVKEVQMQSVLFIVFDDPRPLIERQTLFQRIVSWLLYPRLRSRRVIPVAGVVLSESIEVILSRVRTAFGDELGRYRVLIDY